MCSGTRLYLITHQTESIELIQQVWHDDDSILLDHKKGLYTALGDRRVNKCAFLCCGGICAVMGLFKSAEKQLEAKGQSKGNMKGEGFLLGGVLLLGKLDTGILYEHRENKLGDACNPVTEYPSNET